MDLNPELTILDGGTETTLSFRDRFQIGSAPGSDLLLTDPRVESKHLVIQRTEEGALLVVNAPSSPLRVLVNGSPTRGSLPLEHGDRVELGDVAILFRTPIKRPATGTLRRASDPDAAAARELSDTAKVSITDSQQFSWFDSKGVLQRSLATLYEASKLFGRSTSENALLEETLRLTQVGLVAQRGAVVVRAEGELVEVFVRGRRVELLVEDELLRTIRDGVSTSFQTTDGASVLVVPITRASSSPEGAMWFTRRAPAPPFTREDLELAATLGRQLGGALERVRLLKDLRGKNLEFSRLQRRLEAILDTLTEGLALVTPDGAVAPISPRGRALLIRLGVWSPDQPQAKLEVGSPILPVVTRALTGDEVRGHLISKDDLVVEASAHRVSALRAVVLVLRDVSVAHREAEEHRATEVRLQQEVLEISAREQRRIGQDIHDGLCQTLVAVGLLADDLKLRLIDKELEEADVARRIATTLEGAAGTARDLARGLSPVALEADGLTAALEELAANTSELSGIPCRFESQGRRHLQDNAVAINLYYIAKEAVNNALKHASPSSIVIRLHRANGELVLEIQDDGCGFPNQGDTPGELRGMGMHIMEYRAKSLGARLAIKGAEHGGVRVTCAVSVEP